MRKNIFEKILSEIPEGIKSFSRISMDIASIIADILKEKKITQKDFACGLGKKESEISKWLSGNHNFTIRSLSKIEEALGEQIIFTKNDFQIKYEKIFSALPANNFTPVSDSHYNLFAEYPNTLKNTNYKKKEDLSKNYSISPDGDIIMKRTLTSFGG